MTRGFGVSRASGEGAAVAARGTFLPNRMPAQPMRGRSRSLNRPSECRTTWYLVWSIGHDAAVP